MQGASPLCTNQCAKSGLTAFRPSKQSSRGPFEGKETSWTPKALTLASTGSKQDNGLRGKSIRRITRVEPSPSNLTESNRILILSANPDPLSWPLLWVVLALQRAEASMDKACAGSLLPLCIGQ